MDCSQDTAAKIDTAVQRMLNECYANVVQVLTENRGLLDEISEYLLIKETITGEELMKFVNAAAQPAEEEKTEAAEEEISEE
jgi:cell division protease FtsH